MKRPKRVRQVSALCLSMVLGLAALPAAAAPLIAPAIHIVEEDRGLVCEVVNVGATPVRVRIYTHAEDGSATDEGVVHLGPGETGSASNWVDNGLLTCRFDVLSGPRRRIRAAACEFAVSVGCITATVAR